MIEIMNLRNTKPSQLYDVKVDRSSVLGNPFVLRKEQARDVVCNLYERHFYRILKQATIDIEVPELNRLISLYKQYNRLRLFCWCAPKRCHAETIKTYIEEQINKL